MSDIVCVALSVALSVADCDWLAVALSVGECEGVAEPLGVGACDGDTLGDSLGLTLRVADPLAVWLSLADPDGVVVAEGVGACVGEGEHTRLSAVRWMPRSGAAAPAPVAVHMRPALVLAHVPRTVARPDEDASAPEPPRHATGADAERTSA